MVRKKDGKYVMTCDMCDVKTVGAKGFYEVFAASEKAGWDRMNPYWPGIGSSPADTCPTCQKIYVRAEQNYKDMIGTVAKKEDES